KKKKFGLPKSQNPTPPSLLLSPPSLYETRNSTNCFCCRDWRLGTTPMVILRLVPSLIRNHVRHGFPALMLLIH
ncbi:hypothetical protein LINPERHAP1_LOCUS28312, partial [Linum perenne]